MRVAEIACASKQRRAFSFLIRPRLIAHPQETSLNTKQVLKNATSLFMDAISVIMKGPVVSAVTQKHILPKMISVIENVNCGKSI